MSDLLSTMEHEYFVCCRRADELLATTDSNAEAKEQQLVEAQQQINEADQCVKQMEVEIEGSNIKNRQEMKQKLRTQKQSLDQLRRKLRVSQEEFKDMRIRENLYGGMSEHQRQKLIEQQKGEERLHGQTMKLQEAKMVSYGIEKDAVNIQMELHRHTDLMERNIEKTRMTNSDLSESNMLLKRMQDRIRENKMVLYIVVGLVTLAGSIVVYTHI